DDRFVFFRFVGGVDIAYKSAHSVLPRYALIFLPHSSMLLRAKHSIESTISTRERLKSFLMMESSVQPRITASLPAFFSSPTIRRNSQMSTFSPALTSS